MPEPAWSLHPQLENDTTPVGDLALSRLLAIDDAKYPWLVLVPRCTGATEISDLGGDAARLMEEIANVSCVLKAVTGCDKLNIAAIGNIVLQLHVHVVARRQDDPLWPKPVWGLHVPRAGDPVAFARFVAAVREDLGARLPQVRLAGYRSQPQVPCGAFDSGFIGPSPPQDEVHSYEFTIHALGTNGAVLATTTVRRKFPE